MSTTITTSESAILCASVPENIVVLVNGGPVVADRKVSSTGRPVYKANGKAPVTSEDSHKDILGRASVTFNGQDILPAGRGAYVSEPRLYKATKKDGSANPKAGQTIPNTGGNWTVLHSNMVEIGGLPFQLQVRVTLVTKDVEGEQTQHAHVNVVGFMRVANAAVTVGEISPLVTF